MDADIPYLLLTPGPLTTSRTVRQAMSSDYSTWDIDYNKMVTRVRRSLVALASEQSGYTCTLLQGSGTFAVEATLGSVVPRDGHVLIICNGAYGQRMVQITERLGIAFTALDFGELAPPRPQAVRDALNADPSITHVAMVHCETTTGMLNPASEIGQVARAQGKIYILDAMSSFGGIPMSMEDTCADFLVSSANKCIQGVPGFAFVIATEAHMQDIAGRARSLSLDLHDQWREMEAQAGKWRYTSPTHAVSAFAQALQELEQEGGVPVRFQRYCENHKRLVEGMQRIGFATLLPPTFQSPVITSFLFPPHERFRFDSFYGKMKTRRFVLYPGKVSQADCFRIGTIGHVFPEDIDLLLSAVTATLDEMDISLQ